MIYVATVEHYRDWEEKKVTSFMFVCADSIVKAVEQISNYYGEECLEDVTISPFHQTILFFLMKNMMNYSMISRFTRVIMYVGRKE